MADNPASLRMLPAIQALPGGEAYVTEYRKLYLSRWYNLYVQYGDEMVGQPVRKMLDFHTEIRDSFKNPGKVRAKGVCACGGAKHPVILYTNGKLKLSHPDLSTDWFFYYVSGGYDSLNAREQYNKVPEQMECLSFLCLAKYGKKQTDSYMEFYTRGTVAGIDTYDLERWWSNLKTLDRNRKLLALQVGDQLPATFRRALAVREFYHRAILYPYLSENCSKLREEAQQGKATRRKMTYEVILNVIPEMEFMGAVETPPPSREREAALTINLPLRWYSSVYKKGLPSIVDDRFILSCVRQVSRISWLCIGSRSAAHTYKKTTCFLVLTKAGNKWHVEESGVNYKGLSLDDAMVGKGRQNRL